MGDNWDDGSDDEWDVDDDILEQRLGLANKDDEEEVDLAFKMKEEKERKEQEELKKKGEALAAKKKAEKAKQEERELALKVLEVEAQMEANMTLDERKEMERKRVEDADNALADELFGGAGAKKGAAATTKGAGDQLALMTLKDHLKHAKVVSAALKKHGKTLLATTFLREVIQGSKDTLDVNAISELITACNVIKNEKIQADKRKTKNQGPKSKKAEKEAQAKAKKIHDETFGDNNEYDQYDEIGESYQDDYDFF
uniref:Uncharacterized protein n=1 Tax=Craspedostauros australis TaxID=1486917 RepID=A0A7R9WM26_9STRA|mmetsp:Transcript_10760/g.29700  ORF Transcript_10760/g.29700 Transcript_10760/m.29700 type:complete len:256 (+) Transcript_10760:115-882(+)|eukprot:CAMPEP_0198133130 /NCGR_PEP_ID=MMETSP1442-20131203/59404_1 /TAXON_ID= /ORGANISM="Craspedostauros australis, Strain CCMP3328" /LENGTH=255 /DNA_ID=CAMNT_0043794235 /DNA_START=32 /DNA_END=799 /DNA_ORIENTATION=+